MANKKITDLTADGTLNDTDLMWKDSAGSAASYQITGAELKAYMGGWEYQDDVNLVYSIGGGTTLQSITTPDDVIVIGQNAMPDYTQGGDVVCIGNNAGTSLAGNADDLVIIGNGALETATINISYGSYSTFIGSRAGEAYMGNYPTFCTLIGAYTGADGRNSTAIGGSAQAGRESTSVGRAAGDYSTPYAVNVGFNSGNGGAAWSASLGWNAMASSTGTGGIGVGYEALKVATGTYNTAVGFQALKSNTSGSNNVAVGPYAGDAVTTGYDNILVGQNAGTTITTGYDNVVIGDYGGYSGTFRENVCIGQGVTGIGGGGNNRVHVGFEASGGNNSVAIGHNAHASGSGVSIGANVDGNWNVPGNIIIGYDTKSSFSGSGYNIHLGTRSGENIVSGNQNLFFGYEAGYVLTDADNCIVIGSNADAIHATNDDQIVIGNGGVSPISGYMGARSDLDYSGRTLTLTGPSAYASASTNQDGGDLIMQGGQKASGGGSNGYALHNDNCYGIMSVQAGSTAEATTDGTPRKIAAWNTDGIANGVTVDSTTGNDITIDVAGTYMINVQCSFSGTASKQFDGEIYKNGVATGFAWDRKLGASGDVGSASCVGIVTCAATDTIELYHWSTDGGSSFTVTEAQLTVHRISD